MGEKGGGMDRWGLYNLHIREMTLNVAAALKLCDGLCPRGRIRRSRFEVRGYAPPWEKPDVDFGTGPLRNDDAASVRVEVGTVRLRVRVLDVAAGVVRLAGGGDVAIRGGQYAGEGAVVVVGDGAAVRGV